jgi:hypothetical protein
LAAAAAFIASITESATGTDTVNGRRLWELIDDSQSVTWQNVDNSESTTWTVISTV